MKKNSILNLIIGLVVCLVVDYLARGTWPFLAGPLFITALVIVMIVLKVFLSLGTSFALFLWAITKWVANFVMYACLVLLFGFLTFFSGFCARDVLSMSSGIDQLAQAVEEVRQLTEKMDWVQEQVGKLPIQGKDGEKDEADITSFDFGSLVDLFNNERER